MNFYEILQIPKDADKKIIRIAYETLKKRLALRKNEAAVVQLDAAFAVLSDPEKRARYDGALFAIEKRAHSRVETRKILFIRLASGSVIEAEMLDYSASGARIKTEALLAKGDEVTFLLESDELPFSVATVVRLTRDPGIYGIRWQSASQKNRGKGVLAKTRI